MSDADLQATVPIHIPVAGLAPSEFVAIAVQHAETSSRSLGRLLRGPRRTGR